ncbi:MAG TPA: palindromic element RPE4 domain-containing protein [Rickettsia endosymbiont of Degeeriella rufa]|nr:palindromic element RPE4 domain-containing protein [Rickettsia endosymbiont of Degeeriella rufa]
MTTGSSIKRDKSSFLYLYFLLDPVVKPRDDTANTLRSTWDNNLF